jgi:DNA-binding NtrC family response regulator
VGDPKVVLVVEDSLELARLVELTFRPLGIETISVTSNFDLKTLTLAIDWERVDVAIIDQFLGDVDGKELLAWIAAVHPRIRRILFTGDSQVDEREVNAHQILIKPVNLWTLEEAVRGAAND